MEPQTWARLMDRCITAGGRNQWHLPRVPSAGCDGLGKPRPLGSTAGSAGLRAAQTPTPAA